MANTTVKNLDVQLLNAERKATTIKLDNPKDGLTKAQVVAAYQPAITNGWLLDREGERVMYIGDVIVNTSIKVSLEGEDFYVTPEALAFNFSTNVSSGSSDTKTITVTGADIQAVSFDQDALFKEIQIITNINQENNTADITLYAMQNLSLIDSQTKTFRINVWVNGQSVTVPCSAVFN